MAEKKESIINNRFIKIRNLLLVILGLNWFVALAKIIYGYMTDTSAMVADGFHSFADGASNIIGIVGVLFASRPADEDHPYGHKKYETFASIAISILLFIISFNLIKSAIMRFIHPIVPEVNVFSFVIMAFTMIVNIFVFKYERKKSKELQSDILHADSEHTRSDVFVSISVIATLLAVKAGFPMADTVVALIISFLVAKSAIEILKVSSGVLCDKVPITPEEIKDIVLQVHGVEDVHKVRARGREDDIHIDLHVLVKASMQVGDAHSISEKIEQKVKTQINGVKDIVVHIEPNKQKHN